MTTTDTATPFDQPSAARAASPDPEGGDGAYTFDGRPDRWRRYRLPHPETGRADGWTRATTFAKSISDTYTLSMWSQRMVALGLAARHDLYMAVAASDPADRDGLNNLAEKAKEAAGAKIGANLGTALHAFTEMVDRGETPNIPAPYRPHVAAYQALLAEYDLEVLDIERVVLHLGYDNKGVAGTLDRVVRFTRDVTIEVAGGIRRTFPAGTVMILDLKTGKDLEYGWMEIAVQLSVYANAQHLWDKATLEWWPQWEGMNTDVALVVHLPATAPGETVVASMYAVDIKAGDEIAALCTRVRQERKRKGIATKLSVVREEPVAGIATDHGLGMYAGVEKTVQAITAPITPGWLDRVNNARTTTELNELWFAAMAKREDTPDVLAAITRRNREILADTAAG